MRRLTLMTAALLAVGAPAASWARNNSAGESDTTSAPPARTEQAEPGGSREDATAADETVESTETPARPAETTGEGNGAPAADIRPQAEPRAIMGRTLLYDWVFLVATALVGAVLGALLAAFLGGRRQFELSRRMEWLEQRVKELNSQLGKLRERVLVAEEQPVRSAGRGFRDLDGDGGRTPAYGIAAAPQPTPETARGSSPPPPGPSQRLGEGARRYAELVHRRGKARDFAEAIAAFDRRLGLHFEAPSGLVTLPYREDSPNQLLVALGMDGRFIVVPTYEYISNFRVAFTTPGKNPAVVSEVFDLHQDGSGQLKLFDPAEIALREDGSAEVRKRGQLGGYVG